MHGSKHKLGQNIAKTEYMIISTRQKLQTQLDISQSGIASDDKQINNNNNNNDNNNNNNNNNNNIFLYSAIKRVDHLKSLGLHIDKNLSWTKRIHCRGNFQKISATGA